MSKNIQTNGAIDDVNEAMREAASKLSNDLAQTARDARDAAEELGSALHRSAEGVADDVTARARDTKRMVRRGLRDHPVAWLSAAAGVGALAALLVAPRHSNRA